MTLLSEYVLRLLIVHCSAFPALSISDMERAFDTSEPGSRRNDLTNPNALPADPAYSPGSGQAGPVHHRPRPGVGAIDCVAEVVGR